MRTTFWMPDAQGVKSLLKKPSKKAGLLQIIQSHQHGLYVDTVIIFTCLQLK